MLCFRLLQNFISRFYNIIGTSLQMRGRNQYMGRAYKKQNELNNDSNRRHVGPTEPTFGNGLHERFMQPPPLENSPLPPLQVNSSDQTSYLISNDDPHPNLIHQPEHVSDWATLNHLIVSRLNGQSLWGFTISSSLAPDTWTHYAMCQGPLANIAENPKVRRCLLYRFYNIQ